MTEVTVVQAASELRAFEAPEVAPETPGVVRTRRRRTRRLIMWVGVTWLVLVVAASVLADWLAPYGPLDQDLTNNLQGPSRAHWLGTDQLGRDVLSRLMHGGSDAVFGVLTAVVVAVVVGVPAGLVAGYRKGWVDAIASRTSDLLLTIPGIVLLLTVVSVVGTSLTWAMITLGVLLSAGFFRLSRSSAAEVRTRLYVDASRVAGVRDFSIMVVHVLPNIARPIIVQATLTASVALVVQSGLGFIGLGPPPPAPSWGGMIYEAYRQINQSVWMMVPTGAAVILTALAFNLIGDSMTGDQTVRAPRSRARTSKTDTLPPTSERSLVEVRGLVIKANDGDYPLVDGVSFTVAAGETVAIVGESGCGKTLTALSLLRLLPPTLRIDAGEILLDGVDLTSLDEHALTKLRGSGIAMISQEPGTALDSTFTVGSQIGECLKAHTNLGRRERTARTIELLRSVGIARPESVVKLYSFQLSGGMAQRVAIALALAGSPRVLVADEPTTALDVTVQAELLDLLRALQHSTGMSMIVVTHDWGVVADVADRAIVMYAGEIVEESPIDQIFADGLHPYTRGLLESTPSAEHVGGRLPTITGTVPTPAQWPSGCRFQNRCPRVTEECRAGAIDITTVDNRRVRCIHVNEEAMQR